ncbi:hypothetical protein AX769_19770 [Frondihabitans sp. PAMC 28766]|uniref:GntR family transcriptional regulator n=1 Tax=Frondihabitans sp. PAMC 28766 TaxID=1795630 RepID=UPI00078E4C90|nr:GntR family transcriptional regulator [Frondihabitans sp. PAMC 28766]AMM21972.1 hypothetical protein AX769_19770 [Frondihabitans sp. PAMC 28766]
MSDAPTARTLLRERVLGEIMRAILDGTLAPGARLRDDELIAWLGTSRAPIREALTQLADIGLVDMAPNRYTKVAEVTPRLYAESTAVWATLVTRGMHWGIRDFPADELPLLEALRDAQRDFDPTAFPVGPTVVDRFVGTILAHCRNRVLLETIAVHDPLLQLGVNRYKGFMKSEPITVFFTSVIRRCRDHDVNGFEAEIRAFLGGPMQSFVETMTGFEYYDMYGITPDAGS